MLQNLISPEAALTRGSRLFALSGVASILFGVAVLVWPNIAAVVLLALFAAFALVTGVFMVISGLDLGSQHARHWVPMVFGGLAGIAIGVYTFFHPFTTALALVYLIAVFSILIGMAEFVLAVEFTGQVKGAWALGLAGLVSVAFGVFVAVRPLSGGALAVLWAIGLWAILVGALRIAFAYELNQAKSELKSPVRPQAQPSTATPAGATSRR